ncbi:hypothetical protein MMX123_02728 [Microbacterium sp. MM2322]|uniref:hypothetical protein n=1 Tax=Microbacterium sp. MM2322 TaxID=3157631 RepID=UPI003D808DE9
MSDDVLNPADLYADLELLRKNEGFVAHRLDRVDTVAELLSSDGTDSFDRRRHRFTSAIYSLPDKDANLLLDVFALSDDTLGSPTLRERRRIHGEKIGRKIDAVADREPAALNQLASRLIRGTYPQSPLRLDVPEMHNGIVYESISTLIVVENRRWKKTFEHYRFIATFDEMDYLTVTRSYDGTVYPDPRGAFKVNTRHVEEAGWNDHFWHLDPERTATEPMRRDETYDLKFAIHTPADGALAPMTLASRAFHERALLATIRVQFVGETPSSVWRFERVSAYARPSASNSHNAAQIDERGTVTLRLRDAHGGLFSGIGWAWASTY